MNELQLAVYDLYFVVLTYRLVWHRGLRYHWSHLLVVLFALVVDYSYGQEIFTAWYSADPYYEAVYLDRWSGPYAPIWWSMIFCNVVLVQLLWWPQVRRSPLALAGLAITSNIGMWLERFQIVFTSTHADFMPSAWDTVWPTIWDWLIFAGSLGLFVFLMLVFVRLAPVISIHDMRSLRHVEQTRVAKAQGEQS